MFFLPASEYAWSAVALAHITSPAAFGGWTHLPTSRAVGGSLSPANALSARRRMCDIETHASEESFAAQVTSSAS